MNCLKNRFIFSCTFLLLSIKGTDPTVIICLKAIDQTVVVLLDGREEGIIMPLGANPFVMTKEEMNSLDPHYKRSKKKNRAKSRESETRSRSASKFTPLNQGRLSEVSTKSSRLKNRISANIQDIWDELDSSSSEDKGEKRDPTYELATMKKDIQGSCPLREYVQNGRDMFLLNYLVSVKFEEARRLEVELRDEELSLQRDESQLRLAEKAFDQFLQESDADAMEATKLAEEEFSRKSYKLEQLKTMKNSENGLNREIDTFRDVLKEYESYERFLFSLSPKEWKKSLKTLGNDEIRLYFTKPSQLQEILTKLEDENLSLIQEYRQSEIRLEQVHTEYKETEESLKTTISLLAKEIANLEIKIGAENKEIEHLKSELKGQKPLDQEQELLEVEGLSPECLTLTEYYVLVKEFYKTCLALERGDEVQEDMDKKDLTKLMSPMIEVSSWDEILPMLKEVELIMEKLTQRLEQLPAEQVKIQQRICERDRRLREHAYRVAKQKEMEANRNLKALNRALEEPFRPHTSKTRSEIIIETAMKKSKKKMMKKKK